MTKMNQSLQFLSAQFTKQTDGRRTYLDRYLIISKPNFRTAEKIPKQFMWISMPISDTLVKSLPIFIYLLQQTNHLFWYHNDCSCKE
jgi:hypothetical protein